MGIFSGKPLAKGESDRITSDITVCDGLHSGMNKRAVAYYRVSKKQQGRSGLGLEAQQQCVAELVQRESMELVDSFTEVETGTGKRHRPQLQAAIEACQEHGATLLIAKLDRLARNVHFLSGLMESGVKFQACDMPEADSFTVHILAAVAQREAELISERTRSALAAAKARGTRLGNPQGFASGVQAKGMKTRRQQARKAYEGLVLDHICTLREAGRSYRQIAERLNALGERTRTGKQWSAMQVQRIYSRYCPGQS
jgi:DNA invertase Pin-like site-specific DNA recombinase